MHIFSSRRGILYDMILANESVTLEVELVPGHDH